MGEVSTGRDHCRALKLDGTPCGGYSNASGYCFAHDPARAGALAEARRRGGRQRHGRRIGATGDAIPVALGTLADVLGVLAETVNELRGLEVSVNKARAVAYCLSVWADCFEVSELERRLAALEARQHEQST